MAITKIKIDGVVYEIESVVVAQAISVVENDDGTVDLTLDDSLVQVVEDSSDTMDLIVSSGANVQVVEIDENTVDLIIS